MTTRKLLLNNLLDIGGVATLNNFYSPTAKTHKGGLLFTRKLFKSYLEDGLIEKIEPIGKPANKAREVFYCLTKKGANYIGRIDEYKYKKNPRSPYNALHESMKFDVALSFLRLYPGKKFTFRYDSSFYGVRPDILIRIESSHPRELTRFLLVEIERKKTVDRVFNEKITRYEEMFKAIEKKKSHNLSQFKTLFIYSDLWYDGFLRPQEYGEPQHIEAIGRTNYLVRSLVSRYCRNLVPNRYLFMPFHDFYRLNEAVWFHTDGNRVPFLIK
jgi:hypothetical protein